MKRFLIWLTLGALLFLSSCTQHRYSLHAYRLYTMNNRTENLADAVEPEKAADISPLRQIALHTERSY